MVGKTNVTKDNERHKFKNDPNGDVAVNTVIGGDVSVGIKDTVHNKPTSFSAFGALKIANETIIGDYRFDRASVPKLFDIVRGNDGRYEIEAGETGMRLIANALNDSIELDSKEVHYYQAGRGLMSKQSIILGDSGVAGCKREWGLRCLGNLNGMFLRLDGTDLSWVIKRDGVETVIPSSSWDIPTTIDGNGHLYFQQAEWLGVGPIYLYIDEILVHSYNFTGTSTEFSMGTPDLRLFYSISNESNNDSRYMKMGCASVLLEGGANARRLDQDAEANDLATLVKSQMIGESEDSHGNKDGDYHSVNVTHESELKAYSRQNELQFIQMIASLQGVERQINLLRQDIAEIFNSEARDKR